MKYVSSLGSSDDISSPPRQQFISPNHCSLTRQMYVSSIQVMIQFQNVESRLQREEMNPQYSFLVLVTRPILSTKAEAIKLPKATAMGQVLVLIISMWIVARPNKVRLVITSANFHFLSRKCTFHTTLESLVSRP